jgi:hypothetical protein
MSKSLYILIKTLLEIGVMVALHLFGQDLYYILIYEFFLNQSDMQSEQYILPHP